MQEGAGMSSCFSRLRPGNLARVKEECGSRASLAIRSGVCILRNPIQTVHIADVYSLEWSRYTTGKEVGVEGVWARENKEEEGRVTQHRSRVTRGGNRKDGGGGLCIGLQQVDRGRYM